MFSRKGKYRYIVQVSTDFSDTTRERRERWWFSMTVSGKTAREVNARARSRLGERMGFAGESAEQHQMVRSVRVIAKQGSWRRVVYEAIKPHPSARVRVLRDEIR